MAALGLIALLLLGTWGAETLASHTGTRFLQRGYWLAGILDSLAHWWHHLGAGGQILVVAGGAALIVLSGGSFGLALDVGAGFSTFADHSEGAATFVRNPLAATRSFVSNLTPQQVGLYAFQFVAGRILPAGVGGLAGRRARNEIDRLAEQRAERKLPFWQRKVRAGQKFNRDNAKRYHANEVRLDNGKVLDSYAPRKLIVSRKLTQLGKVQESTARAYLKELSDKYKVGAVISDTPANRARYPHLVKTPLDGDLVLEVPVQKTPIQKSILDYATKLDIRIIDVTGHVYN